MDDTTAGFTQAWLLIEAMDRERFTLDALWSGYLGQGGNVEQFEIEAYLHQCLHLPAFQRDILIHAANHLLEAHHQRPLPYTRDLLHGADTTPDE
ncbi:hypothetical protein RF644_09040 [Kocuria sp. CPCC 205258]|jgi:hypothetical protein|uniref:hypothetical protein n=1 Tax=Kocuria sp. CPCC 205258 TaxID=3073552 RepID=UPI0034D7547D